MLLIGLTGSIATGKSTVSSILSQPPYSLPIIDADLIAREVVEPGTGGYKAIVDYFGGDTPDLLVEPSDTSMPVDGPTGLGRPLNRPALGRRVFGDSEQRQRDRAVLNSIVHPAVRSAMLRRVLGYYVRGYWAVVLDVPLLFESRLDRWCGATLVVGVRDRAIQMRRLRERDPHLSEEEAESRVISQTDVRLKAEQSRARGEGKGLVVWNDGTREELRLQIDDAMRTLRRGSDGWWSWLLLACPPLAIVVALWRVRENARFQREWEVKSKEIKGKL